MPVGEAMFTQRAIRKFKPDPIGDEQIELMLDAASRAPRAIVQRSSGLQAWCRKQDIVDHQLIELSSSDHGDVIAVKKKDGHEPSARVSTVEFALR